MVFMHCVQTLILTRLPSITKRCEWTLGWNMREVCGAFRFQRPECLWRMLRPKTVFLPQTSQSPAMSYSLFGTQCGFVTLLEA